MPLFHHVCSVDDVPNGESRLFVVQDQLVGIFNIDGQYFALNNLCPHAGASLAHGETNGDIVTCRIHHWRFCVRDGRYVDEDKPQYNAKTYAVRVTDGGMIEVDLDTQATSIQRPTAE